MLKPIKMTRSISDDAYLPSKYGKNL
jgi:hypothetical protein